MTYKFPLWLKNSKQTNLDGSSSIITAEQCNLKCHCLNAIQAMFCMEGHMTECHAGMTCKEAECSHYQTEEEYYHNEFDERGGEEDAK